MKILKHQEIVSNTIVDQLKTLLEEGYFSDAADAIETCMRLLKSHNVTVDGAFKTNYVNTIAKEDELEYPGDLELEDGIQNINRWNAMAMVVKANREHDGLGGHISSYASIATLYEVAFNHFFKGNNQARYADQIFFQGHTSPGVYARAYLEGRLEPSHLHNFRQELGDKPGLSSYPHPYLMSSFWQFPTVSMGLGPILAIYQARFNRYMKSRGLLPDDADSTVYCFVGDGEADEPETFGALSIAAREKLDNLVFVVNCNLQRLDGPVRGNSKVIQEFESIFKGAGWNVIKLVWGSQWDELLACEHRDLLIKRMNEAVDGDYQKYVVEPGSYFRKHFFGKYPDLLEMVSHLTDRQLKQLLRGGHDPKKVYNAYRAAKDHKGQPTVILAKTVKGYGLGEAGEGKNISHQQKKLNEKELREYREKLMIPVSDEDVVDAPFYRPKKNSKELNYVLAKRKQLGGFIPERKSDFDVLQMPKLADFASLITPPKTSISTTMAFVRILSALLRDKAVGKHIVPIIPDEARTFGMESFFKQYGIYSQSGQLYEPVDFKTIIYYREEKDGQILEEGINESGAMCSFISSGTSYSTHGVQTIPFYIYYSMFGFQRIGDLMWLAADMKTKGFLLGGTAGRTTLNGEGLQHQDGHSHLIASTIPTLKCYDPVFMYEIAVIVFHGMQDMYVDKNDVFYYLTIGNENYLHQPMPKGCEKGILAGMYKFNSKKAVVKTTKKSKKKQPKAHILGSGSIFIQALKAQEILINDYQIDVDLWSVTSYKQLRADAVNCDRKNMLNPTKPAKKSYLETVLAKQKGVFVAASDNMRVVSDQISKWVPGGLFSLGTDGFGRSDTREKLRRFFEVDAQCIVLATLYQLALKGDYDMTLVEKARKQLGIDLNKSFPEFI